MWLSGSVSLVYERLWVQFPGLEKKKTLDSLTVETIPEMGGGRDKGQ
jgi:hypothetical protein